MDSPLSIINYLYYLAVKESQQREKEQKEREEAERKEAANQRRSGKKVPYLKPTGPYVGRLEAEAFEDEMLGG